jgi:hypothetical protein
MAPATKRREAPGRYGITTSPVSQKLITKRIRYVYRPYVSMIPGRYLSK